MSRTYLRNKKMIRLAMAPTTHVHGVRRAGACREKCVGNVIRLARKTLRRRGMRPAFLRLFLREKVGLTGQFLSSFECQKAIATGTIAHRERHRRLDRGAAETQRRHPHGDVGFRRRLYPTIYSAASRCR